MMQGMMGDGTAGAMMWGMGLFGVFVIIVRTREVHLFRPVGGGRALSGRSTAGGCRVQLPERARYVCTAQCGLFTES
jgi:hypothetical protein